ncbi:pantetheine-phosphate adenylyltransferase [Vagococcus sp. CY53-2]|uniref:pantetheine-phosphate adenylyltransferase n=1 Tax=Vagococcus sp. CY53-2 TaxID=2925780 RepID=UPI001F50D755|nr:pantetheine-phosphate adenylyltransferase [Vagococcus sp. CY53-2]MCI0130152.1 pantetheine-phosphate adenylyltransferase [Vagococcus sp. CY53-2]
MIKKRIALFPGSFDPVTNGHLNTIKKASRLFDELVVGVFTNTTKKTLFTPIERQKFIAEEVKELENVSVRLCDNDLTIRIAEELGADYLVRGIRNQLDYEYEKSIAVLNKHLSSHIETIFLISDEEYNHISSSMVKEIAKFQGNITDFVPEKVNDALKLKFK